MIRISQATCHLAAETAIAIKEVPMYLPRRAGRKVHYSTVFRWASKGSRGRVLESMLVGGIRYTTLEALERFVKFKSQSVQRIPATNADVEQALLNAGL